MKSSQVSEIHPTTSEIVVDDMKIISILSNQGITIQLDHEVGQDEAKIMALGYRQQFKREFSLWTVFSVSFSVLGMLPSIATTFFNQQLIIGASPIPWLIGTIFVTSVALSLAEVASAFPVSSGPAYAVSQLSPPKYKAFLTWTICWADWFSQITGPPAINYSCASMLLALVSYNSTDFVITHGKVFGISVALQTSQVFIACSPTKWAANVNSLSAIINVIFLIVAFVVILGGNDRLDMYKHSIPKFNTNSEAWGLNNLTNYPTGVATLMSFLGVIWSMSGYDAPFHFAEECSNASVAVPTAIILTSTVGGLIGFLFMIAISYTMVDIKLVASDPLGLGQPFVSYLTQFLTVKLVNTTTALTIVSTYFMGSSCMLGASRITFAYSRDHLLPFSKYWKLVNGKTQTPVNAVWCNYVIGILLLILIFAGPTAIGAVFSVGAIAGFISFTMPTLLKITYARSTFIPGPVSLGKYSVPIGIVSVAFVTLMIPILCMPTSRGSDLTLEYMNWTSLVFFGPMSIVTAWFLISARKWYKGPRSNLNESDLVVREYTNEKVDSTSIVKSMGESS